MVDVACRHCGSASYKRNGLSRGTRRYLCRSCGRTFTDRAPRFDAAVKARAVEMHLNNVGVRKIARFLGCSPASVVNWLRAAHRALPPGRRRQACGSGPDVIEMDEIYTFVQKSAAPSSGAPTRAPKRAS